MLNRTFALSLEFENILNSLKIRLNNDLDNSQFFGALPNAKFVDKLKSDNLILIKQSVLLDLSAEFERLRDPLTSTITSQTSARIVLSYVPSKAENDSSQTSFTADLLSGLLVVDQTIPCVEGRIKC